MSREVVLVTGSSGRVGTAVVRRLVGEYEVVSLDVKQPVAPIDQAHMITFDVSSDESVSRGLAEVKRRSGERIASCVHLAGYYDFSGNPSEQYENITVRGTERLLRGLRTGFTCEQFAFSSTMLVHAPCPPCGRINEDSPIEAQWDYPQSKVDAEKVIFATHGNVPVVLARIAGVYDDQCHSIPLAQQIERIYQRSLTSRVFPGDISQGQAFVHLDDLAEFFALCVRKRKELPGEFPVLVGEPETLSYGQLQRDIARLLHGEEWTTARIPKVVAKAGAIFNENVPLVDAGFIKPWMIDQADNCYTLDINRARTELGWEPKHSLSETLPQIVAQLKSDPVKWHELNKRELAA